MEVFQEEFRKAGYTIATAPGADVLRLSPSIVKLYINAPDVMSPDRSRTYTIDAGEATLVLKARDSVSGALLGMAVDRREARGTGFVTWTNSVTNRSDFRRLFQQWARICIKGLDELKASSPVRLSLKAEASASNGQHNQQSRLAGYQLRCPVRVTGGRRFPVNWPAF